MSMPENTATILEWRGYQSLEDFVVADDARGNITIEEWNHADPEPSEAQLNAWAVDPAFAAWNTPVERKRRRTKDGVSRDPRLLAIAAALARLSEEQAEGYNALLQAFRDGANANAIITAVRALPDLPTYTPAQAVQFLLNRIDAGDVD